MCEEKGHERRSLAAIPAFAVGNTTTDDKAQKGDTCQVLKPVVVVERVIVYHSSWSVLMPRKTSSSFTLSLELARDCPNAPWGFRLRGGADVDVGPPLEVIRVSQMRDHLVLRRKFFIALNLKSSQTHAGWRKLSSLPSPSPSRSSFSLRREVPNLLILVPRPRTHEGQAEPKAEPTLWNHENHFPNFG